MPYKDPQKRKEFLKEYFKRPEVKIRQAELSKTYREKNKEKIKELQHKRYLEHRVLSDRVLLTDEQKKEKSKKSWTNWYLKNQQKKIEDNKFWVNNNRGKRNEKIRIYSKKRRKNSKKISLDISISTLMYLSLKRIKQNKLKRYDGYWEKLVGYSFEELVIHLENLFDEKMDWNNYGNYWTIDHIKPKCLFNYISPYNIEFKECWALSNIQPLEKTANSKKGSKYEEKALPASI